MPNFRPIGRRVQSIQTLEGGGFPVRRPFPIQGLIQVDPFLLLDHFGPVTWGPGEAIGAPDHPHRGFQAVTYLLQGENLHKDSFGGGGALGPGDVQWMTAGSGVVHSELPSAEFKKKGGTSEGFQLWVNLPASHKMIPPEYQELKAEQIPTHSCKGGEVKVIAGEAFGLKSPVQTMTPISYLHLMLEQGGEVELPVPEGHTSLAYLAQGEAKINQDYAVASTGEMIKFTGEGDAVGIKNTEPEQLSLILLTGEPIMEPIARHGPFVMNTQAELIEAFEDYNAGKMGKIG